MKEAQPVRAADMSNVSASHEGEQCLSYGTAKSEEEAALDLHANSAKVAWVDRLESTKGYIATQKEIVAKLESLEKAVVSVQEDMASLRAEVRVVHEVVEQLAKHVSLLTNTVTNVDEVPTHRSPDQSAWGQWQGGPANDEGILNTEIAENDRVDMGREEPSHIHRDHCANNTVRETQEFDRCTSMPGLGANMAEESGGEGCYKNPGKQRARCKDDDMVDLGSHQVEMTFDGQHKRRPTSVGILLLV